MRISEDSPGATELGVAALRDLVVGRHAYSPRLRRLGAYAFTPGGPLKRHPLGYGEELRPVEAA